MPFPALPLLLLALCVRLHVVDGASRRALFRILGFAGVFGFLVTVQCLRGCYDHGLEDALSMGAWAGGLLGSWFFVAELFASVKRQNPSS